MRTDPRVGHTMANGWIDKNLEARLELMVCGPDERKAVEFLIDTGFNGYLAVPISLVRELNLPLGVVQSGVTADGRAGYFDTVSLQLIWHGVPMPIRAQVLDEPLIGTRLLRGNSFAAQWVVNGPFSISPLNLEN